VKKGRHRRFVEARELKHTSTTVLQPCPECGAEPEDRHAEWCLAEDDRYEQIMGDVDGAEAVDLDSDDDEDDEDDEDDDDDASDEDEPDEG
jgi:23S rRNA pseudouridine2605 synthase